MFQVYVIFSQEVKHRVIDAGGNEKGSLFFVNNRFYLVGETDRAGTIDIYVSELDDSLITVHTKIFHLGSSESGSGIIGLDNHQVFVTASGVSQNNTILLSTQIETDNTSIVNDFGVSKDRLDKSIATNDKGLLIYGELGGLVPGNRKAALMKFNQSMIMEWRFYYDYQKSDEANPDFEMTVSEVKEDSDGGYLILGTYSNVNNSSGESKIRLIKVNKRGYLEWVIGYHGGKMDQAISLTPTKDNSWLVLANTTSYTGNQDLLLLKINKRGELLWGKNIGSSFDDYGVKVLEEDNGNILLAGHSKDVNESAMDITLFYLTNEGALNSTYVFGGSKDDLATNMIIKDQELYVSGYTNSQFGGSQDFYLIWESLNQAPIGCSTDITDLFSVQNITTTNIYHGNYAHRAFNLPQGSIAEGTNITIDEFPVCYSCPKDEKSIQWLCENENLIIDKSIPTAVSYVWQDGSTDSIFSVKDSGTYWVEIETNFCTYRDTINVYLADSNPPLPDMNITICKSEAITLNANMKGAISFNWSDGSKDSLLTITKEGNYTVTINTVCGEVKDEIEIEIPVYHYRIPNVFTPNKDGVNDRFEIESKSNNNQSLTVFDRSGKEVYSSDNYNNSWDGSGLTTGVYFYQFVDQCTEEQFKGWVHLMK